MVDLLLGRVLPWLLVGLEALFIYWLVANLLRQLGKLLLRQDEVIQRLEALEKQVGQSGPPARKSARLPVGSAAPPFELPDLAGRQRSLAEFRGRRVLLIFFSPRCGYCQKMAADLAALPPDGSDGWPIPVVVTTGDAEENRQLVQANGVRCSVLLQKEMEIANDKYDIYATPMGYLIDEQGNIAAEAAAGAEKLLALALASKTDAAEQREKATLEHGKEVKSSKGKANKGLAASRVNRSGLPAGTPAPGFRLPRLDGGELALQEYRGRRVLLVFSDPVCSPCDQLAPHLERLHREGPNLAVLMIGRRDPELNRQKVAKLGLTLPVVLQRSWEISLLYGMFATPVAYLVDEQGTIAADVATGVEPILDLVSRATVGANGKEPSRRAQEAVPRPA